MTCYLFKDGGKSAPDGGEHGDLSSDGGDGQHGGWRADLTGGEGEEKGDGQGGDRRRTPEVPNPFRLDSLRVFSLEMVILNEMKM